MLIYQEVADPFGIVPKLLDFLIDGLQGESVLAKGAFECAGALEWLCILTAGATVARKGDMFNSRLTRNEYEAAALLYARFQGIVARMRMLQRLMGDNYGDPFGQIANLLMLASPAW